MKISIKLKFLFLLLTIPIVGFLTFSYLAQKTFEKDKLAYVYSSSAMQAQALKEKTLSILNFWKLTQEVSLSGVDWDKGQFSFSILQLLGGKPDLITQVSRLKSQSRGDKSIRYFSKKLDLESQNKIAQHVEKSLTEALGQGRKLYFAPIDLELNQFVLVNQFQIDGSSDFIQVATLFENPQIVSSFFDKGMFESLLVDRFGRSLFQGKNNFETMIGQSKLLDYFKSKISSGSIELTGEQKYIGSFSYLDQDIYIITLAEESKVMMALSTLKKQTTLFLIIAICACVILAFIFSQRLTSAIQKLFDATESIAKGDYDIDLKVKTNDEIEVLAFSFESMAKKVSSLLKELKRYNEQLEQLVAERTAELNTAMKMQKSILESLGQGFFIFNKEGEIQSVYSQAAVKMFHGVPAQKNYWSLISQKPEVQQECSELFNAAFDSLMPFEDVKTYAPHMYVNNDHQIIELDYHPIQNEEDSLSSVIVVATDKTKEIESEKALEKERAQIKMIQKVISQRHHFERFVGDFQQILSYTHKMVANHRQDLLPDILRQLHTLKGNSSLYSLVEIKDKVHEVEMRVKEQIKENNLDWSGLHSDLSLLTDLFEDFLKKNQKLLGISLNDADSKIELSYPMMQKLYSKLQSSLPANLASELNQSLFYIPVSEFLKAYPDYALELAVRLDKKLAPIEVIGGDLKVKLKVYDDFFLAMIHLLRNSLDHGLEGADERIRNGKSAEGHLLFSFKNESNMLLITFEDDGRGFDLAKIFKNNIPSSENEIQQSLIRKLFYEGTSTKTEVTDISGQGAGLAAVGLVVDKLKGSIKIDLKRKAGVAFIFKFPYV